MRLAVDDSREQVGGYRCHTTDNSVRVARHGQPLLSAPMPMPLMLKLTLMLTTLMLLGGGFTTVVKAQGDLACVACPCDDEATGPPPPIPVAGEINNTDSTDAIVPGNAGH